MGTKERPTWYPTGNYIWPVYGSITSRFGYRYIFGSYSYHSGLDIAVPYGTSVKASDGGTVTFAGYKGSYGYLVIITHDNGIAATAERVVRISDGHIIYDGDREGAFL